MAEDKQTPPDKRTASGKATASDNATPSYEQAREELTEVVRRLETGGLTLEQSIELWERGERLAAICEEWLQGARAKLAAAMAQRQEPQPNGPEEAPF
ncbi:exodeoxyribonuclease VII small subunit [Microbispora hainanensis]|uniref:Exodeoxyribonuclease 7 small subunit n=1 Tax=Microbispora hainanensis TaxID=568844 RepID=A0ABZ1SNJ9_9ACTN|nr:MULTISPECIES: exodeoxyribonuclease VII small subunit [Microbispora]NJP27944.1 exodeoxyribonuclease VII small subunit [Microbispora sp. CL1-1]TQS10472.1 exodeoxyribonuclease VII small subunit [Microbispora sp. SCL1-1]